MRMHTLVEGGSFFEAPRWHGDRWYVSDFYRHAVFSCDADGGDMLEVVQVGDQPSGLGWWPDGTMLVVSMLDRRLLRLAGASRIEQVADLSPFEDFACNDMVVDGNGWAWIGTFGFDFFGGDHLSTASILRVDSDGTVAVAADGLRFPNGLVVTPDGSTLIVGETFGSRYAAFTIRPDGTLADRRIWAERPTRSIYPDGCCLDADGRIWCADANGRGCLLIEEGGRILSEVPAPDGLHSYACMLGGPEGTTLLACCAPDSHKEHRQRTRDSILVVTEVDVPGAGYP